MFFIFGYCIMNLKLPKQPNELIDLNVYQETKRENIRLRRENIKLKQENSDLVEMVCEKEKANLIERQIK